MSLYYGNPSTLVSISFAIILITAPAFAAAEPSYDHFDVSYTDASDGVGEGLSVGASHRFNPNGFVAADYYSLDFLDRFSFGGGYILGLSDRKSVDLTLGYEDWTNGVDDSAVVLGTGVRYQAAQQLEVDGGVEFYSFDRADNDLALSGGLAINFTDHLDGIADLEYFLDSGFRVFRLGGRIRF